MLAEGLFDFSRQQNITMKEVYDMVFEQILTVDSLEINSALKEFFNSHTKEYNESNIENTEIYTENIWCKYGCPLKDEKHYLNGLRLLHQAVTSQENFLEVEHLGSFITNLYFHFQTESSDLIYNASESTYNTMDALKKLMTIGKQEVRIMFIMFYAKCLIFS